MSLLDFYLFIVFYPAAVILVFVSARYRVPTVPILAIVAAAGVVQMIELVRGREWKKLALPACVAVASVLLGTIPGPFAEEQVNYLAEMHLNLGVS